MANTRKPAKKQASQKGPAQKKAIIIKPAKQKRDAHGHFMKVQKDAREATKKVSAVKQQEDAKLVAFRLVQEMALKHRQLSEDHFAQRDKINLLSEEVAKLLKDFGDIRTMEVKTNDTVNVVDGKLNSLVTAHNDLKNSHQIHKSENNVGTSFGIAGFTAGCMMLFGGIFALSLGIAIVGVFGIITGTIVMAINSS